MEHSLSEVLKMGVNYSFVKKKIKNFALMDGSSLDAKPINQPNHKRQNHPQTSLVARNRSFK